jgi:riboflavin synthase
MFTGIIENTGIITNVTDSGSNRIFRISSELSGELKPDQSVAHDGVCLTVEQSDKSDYQVTAVAETLSKTTLSAWVVGKTVNLERCLSLPARLDGHMVLGHVDTRGTCTSVKEVHGSWIFRFSYPSTFAALLVEKGSIAINGVSLTVFDVTDDDFSVTIIPYTFSHTNIQAINPGNQVNLEFDILGKYVNRNLEIFRRP